LSDDEETIRVAPRRHAKGLEPIRGDAHRPPGLASIQPRDGYLGEEPVRACHDDAAPVAHPRSRSGPSIRRTWALPWASPRVSATRAASARVCTPSFLRMLPMWVRTVFELR